MEFINEQSQGIVHELAAFLSIDEMMKLSKGCHSQTLIMKQKPIKKGFKFWACFYPVTGFVYRSMPSGRMEKERIFNILMDMAKSLPGMDTQEETEDTDLVFVMDNYFTLPKFVGKTGLWGIAVLDMLVLPGQGKAGRQSQSLMLKTKDLILSITMMTLMTSAFFVGLTTMLWQ